MRRRALVLLSEGCQHVVADLERSRPDAWAEPCDEIRVPMTRAHQSDGILEYAGGEASPAGMGYAHALPERSARRTGRQSATSTPSATPVRPGHLRVRLHRRSDGLFVDTTGPVTCTTRAPCTWSSQLIGMPIA